MCAHRAGASRKHNAQNIAKKMTRARARARCIHACAALRRISALLAPAAARNQSRRNAKMAKSMAKSIGETKNGNNK
jgi:hypothetical protein